jgi:hypothetical protein
MLDRLFIIRNLILEVTIPNTFIFYFLNIPLHDNFYSGANILCSSLHLTRQSIAAPNLATAVRGEDWCLKYWKKTFISRKSCYFLLRYFCKRMRNLSCISSTCLLSTRSSMSGQKSRSRESRTYSSAVWNSNVVMPIFLRDITGYRRPGANIPKQVSKLSFQACRRAWKHRRIEHLLGVQFFNLQLLQHAV